MHQRIKAFLPFSNRSYGYYNYQHFYKEQIDQADVSRLVSRLRVKINDKHRKLSRPTGPEGRLLALRQTVTALVKYERIELNYNRGHESQGYAERLISEAIRHGDCHIATMEMADFWLLEKQLIHKLFKVLVPRFEQYTTSYTRLYNSPRPYFADGFYKPPKDNYVDVIFAKQVSRPKGVLELKGNPYPPIIRSQVSNPNLLHNVLLRAASEEKRNLHVTESLRAQGLIRKSEHIRKLLDKSASRLASGAYLGSDQGEINEDIVRESRAESDVKTVGGEETNAVDKFADRKSAKDSQPDEEPDRVPVDDQSSVKKAEKSESITETTKPN